jgi:hypothetical protein
VAQTVELEARLDQKYPDLMAGMSGTAQFNQDTAQQNPALQNSHQP